MCNERARLAGRRELIVVQRPYRLEVFLVQFFFFFGCRNYDADLPDGGGGGPLTVVVLTDLHYLVDMRKKSLDLFFLIFLCFNITAIMANPSHST